MDSTSTIAFVAFGLVLAIAAAMSGGTDRVASSQSRYAEDGVGILSRNNDWMNHRGPRSLGEARSIQVEALRRQAEFMRSMDRISRDSDE